MVSLEDKILGNKAHVYCSSSESEGDEDSDKDDGEEEKAASSPAEQTPATPSAPEPYKWEGSSTNTGPKGVMKDWQRFKQLEVERRADQERERLELFKKLSLTCQSALDEERANAAEDPDLVELLSDDFLLQYQKERMKEMMSQATNLPTFGRVVTLTNGKEFLDAVDKEDKSVTVVIHIYEMNVRACAAMNGSLISLSQDYPQVKFCKIIGSVAGVSKHFKASGLPALLVYKAGSLISSFVQLAQELGNDFYAEDVESLLTEHGMLPDKTQVPSIIKSGDDDADDSDLSLE